jgi:hypothetical protein
VQFRLHALFLFATCRPGVQIIYKPPAHANVPNDPCLPKDTFPYGLSSFHFYKLIYGNTGLMQNCPFTISKFDAG